MLILARMAYRPPYLYWGPQPVLKEAPHQIHYRGIFELKVSGEDVDTDEIGAVALLRTGPITHNWAWGNQYVKLPFKEKPDRKQKKESTLEVKAPHLPGLAIAGDYLLFVVNKKGIPSEGTHIRLRLDD
jgi:Galactose oxidase-like, Early set domain